MTAWYTCGQTKRVWLMNQEHLLQLYEQQIKPLPRATRLQLLVRIAQDLGAPESTESEAELTLLDMEGLGADIWHGIDAQQYVDALRG